MKRFFPLALVVMCLSLVACVNVGSGQEKNENSPRPENKTQVNQVNQVIPLELFDKIEVSGAMQVTYEPGESSTVKVDAPDDVFNRLVILVDRGHLRIGTKRTSLVSSMLVDFGKAKIHVTCRTLKSIGVNGSGTFQCERPFTADNLSLELTGSGTIHLADLTCNQIDTDLTGSGSVTFGTIHAKHIESDVTGSGSVTYGNAQANYALSKVTGSGSVSLTGTVQKHDEQVTGSGSVDTSGLK